jgi:hypothetical protein
MSAVVVEDSIDCASDAGALWGVVADTERLNRAAGLGALELKAYAGESAAGWCKAWSTNSSFRRLPAAGRA